MREEAAAEKEKISRARKARMMQLEDDAKKKTKKSDSEEISEARKKLIRKQAQEKIDQANDLVKLLNTYSQRAMAFTIRDQQMADKKRRDALEGDYEKRMDIAMEIDRLKELSEREKEENSKLAKRIGDRHVIIDQIEARKKLKILQEEAREQENKQMLQTIKKYEEEDRSAAAKKARHIATSKVEVIKANKEAIESKRMHNEREKEEVEVILAYQAKQDEKMTIREDEEAEKKNPIKESRRSCRRPTRKRRRKERAN